MSQGTTAVSLFRQGKYSQDWIKDFYTQSAKWWGAEVDPAESQRFAAIERFCGSGAKRILELGAGAGFAAALMADHGHHVVAVEFSPVYASYAREHLKTPRAGTLEIVEENFYTVMLTGRFDAICYWDGFGVGSDADHRRLLQRMAREWLAPGGSVLLDVFSPIKPARDANTFVYLKRMDDVPESVSMNRRCHFDPVNCRWIDEWEPADNPEHALAQTVRCYTPADFQLLLEGTGLKLKQVEVDGVALDFESASVISGGPLMEAYSYRAQLQADVRA
jgi:SAM-dependent methyltransferase